MKIILADGVKKYRDKKNKDPKELEIFVGSHRLFKKEMGQEHLVHQIESEIKKHPPGSRSQQT